MHYNRLEKILPHDTLFTSTSSLHPTDIIKHLQDLKQQHRTRPVALCNGDVWRYGSDPDLLDFLQNDGRMFFIITLGYENKFLGTKILEISWPFWYFGRPKNDPEYDHAISRSFGFSCLNNNSSFHRLVLGCKLFDKCLIDEMIFSQNLTDLPGGYYENLMSEVPRMSDYIATLPRRWPDDPSDDFIKDGNSLLHPAYHQSYCNIVTETEVQDLQFGGAIIDLPITTEKTYKPFRSKQIPVWLAAPGQMHYLKSLGFETMQDLMSENFDRFGIFEKAHEISELVSNGHQYIQDFYHSHIQEIQHNYDLVHSDTVENLLVKRVKDFLNSIT